MSETSSPDLHRSQSPRLPRSRWLRRRFPPHRSSWASTAREIPPSGSFPFSCASLLLRVPRFGPGASILNFLFGRLSHHQRSKRLSPEPVLLPGIFHTKMFTVIASQARLSFPFCLLFLPFLSRNKAARGLTGFISGASTPPFQGGEYIFIEIFRCGRGNSVRAGGTRTDR